MGNSWLDLGWEEYVSWQTEDRKTLRRINAILKDIERNGHKGIGNPKALRGNWKGWYSRRIDDKNRLIYRIDEGNTIVASCRGHYSDK